MKKTIAILVASVLAVAAFAQDGRSIYNKFSDRSGVSAVYISPAMFRLMGTLPDMNLSASDQNIVDIIKTFNGLYLIESQDGGLAEGLGAEVESMVRSGRYEMLMEAKDDGQTVRIYTCGDELIKSFVLFTRSADECTFICIDGDIRRSDLSKFLGTK